MANETTKLSVKERIIKISNELRIDKDGKNDFQRFSYFKPDDIAIAINPLLEKYELIALFNMPFNREKDKYEGKLRIENLNTTEGVDYGFDIPMTELKGAGAGQNAGATLTYCKRYMLMSAFNIADNKADPDGKEPAQPKDEKTNAKPKQTVAQILEKIKATKTKKDIETWKKWIPESGYKQIQQNLMLRALEEAEKNAN